MTSPRSPFPRALAPAAAILLAACVTVQHIHVGGGSPDDGSWLFSEQSSAAMLTVRGLQFGLPGGQRSKTIVVFVDGARIAECEVSETPSDICVQDQRIAPGPHAIDVAIGCIDPETTRWLGCRYDLSDSFVVGPREHASLDLSLAIAHPDEQERYLTRREAREIDAPHCIQALEALAYAPSCNSEQLAQASRIAEEAARVCSFGRLGGGHRTAAQVLLTRAVDNHFNLPIDRCYAGHERGRGRGRIPRGIETSWSGVDVPGGSWGWARSVLPRTVADESSPEALLEHVRRGLEEMGPRLDAVTDIIAAFRDETKVDELRRHAMAGPWSFDARHPNGHRHLWIVAAELHDPTYDEHLATHVAADPSLHCYAPEAVSLLLPYFLHQRRLSGSEWLAVQAMLQRTPPDARVLPRCTHVFNPNLECEVPLDDRLRWLGRWDCSEARHPALRGQTFERELHTGSPNDIPEELSMRMRQEFSYCFAGPPPRLR